MDSFFTTTPVVVDTPTNEDSGSGSGNSYCVVAQTVSIPTNEDSGSGSGNSYCVVA
ncbi:hypothetical protein HYPSUDRAFT_85499 [Hypholoma sublateritium FD-334 SS-4]|uniref:Fungal mating-type pheromone n=1 Tax=Hypholoma sublateritium (strain FD-334 SS-4) TaxID=945553 RepID=A0A0D2Q1G0_HYPSF|nr:hypothetical protein HYPSUDRAFT_85499 [Hypholoma sublateritium FD-334 SS-4]